MKTMCVRNMNAALPDILWVIEHDSTWSDSLIETRKELELKEPDLPEHEIIRRLRLSDSSIVPNEPVRDTLGDTWEKFQAIHRDWIMLYLNKVERQLTIFRDQVWNQQDKTEGAYETEGDEA